MREWTDVWSEAGRLRASGVAGVVVTVTEVRGSVPGERGAKALVTAEGLVVGTLGGGKVEARAVAEAKALLEGGEACATRTWNLQRDVGMTCGGEMSFLFERLDPGEAWSIVIFGAGHVAQALVRVLATLRCRIEVVDEREDWLARLPQAGNVRRHRVGRFEEGVRLVGKESFVVSITKGHAADRPVLREVLRTVPEVAFLGVIGSAAKRSVLLRELREDGLPEELLAKLVCPLGLPVGGNDPAEIAVSIAAQLLERRGP